MNVNIKEKYFMMSFMFNKKKPEDFKLIPVEHTDNTFIHKKYKSLWKQFDLYDFGWGEEYGFVRLPELTFDEIWYLLLNSKIDDNIFGSVAMISKVHFDELYKTLLNIFSNPNYTYSKSLKKAFKLLKLEKRTNKSDVKGKDWLEIDRDYRKWVFISERVEQILSPEDT
jgi:hypothetical protein